jgi:hypothetical protein
VTNTHSGSSSSSIQQAGLGEFLHRCQRSELLSSTCVQSCFLDCTDEASAALQLTFMLLLLARALPAAQIQGSNTK